MMTEQRILQTQTRAQGRVRWKRYLLLLSVLLLLASGLAWPTQVAADSPYIQQRPTADGIGKVYLGREIAQVMGHQGAAWLERPGRRREEAPDRLIQALDLKPSDQIADIGAGTGYFSFPIARRVPQGQVFAVDIQPEMLEVIEYISAENKVSNISPILGGEQRPNLAPATIDLALMVDAYHEFAYPREMMQGIIEALKPGGRVVLAEYRAENPLVMIKGLHKMSQAQVRRELEELGLIWQKTDDRLPQQHLLFFEKANPIGGSPDNPSTEPMPNTMGRDNLR
jgi:SAM-dependent methyltransferase